jgi:hypothetical protein
MINQSLRKVSVASGDRSEAGSKRLDDVRRRLAGRNLEDMLYLGSLVCAFLLALTMLW